MLDRPTNPHVTIKYGLITTNPEEVANALGKFIPIRVMFGMTKMFMFSETQPDEDIIIVDAFGMSLKRLRQRLEAKLDHKDVYSSYYPHCTVARVQPGHALDYVGRANPLVGKKMIADSVRFITPGSQSYIITTRGEVTQCESLS